MGRARSQMCRRGHDTHVSGRYSNGSCIACQTTGNRPGRPSIHDAEPNPVLPVGRRFCNAGHDTRKLGRRENGQCSECHRARARDWIAIKRHTERGEVEAARARLPFAPLEGAIIAGGYRLYQACNAQSLADWRANGIPPLTADALSFRLLGTHPGQIFGFDVWLGLKERKDVSA